MAWNTRTTALAALFLVLLVALSGCNVDTQAGNDIIADIDALRGTAGPLIAHYAFDQPSGITAMDSSGNDLDGIIFGASHVSGQIGNALAFSAPDSHVDIPHYFVDIFPDGVITVDAWINPSATGAGANYHIIGGGYGFLFRITDGKPELSVYSGGTPIPVITALTALTVSVWSHIAATLDGTTARIYINGVEENSSLGSYPIGEMINTPTMGSPGLGMLDEVRLFNVALTQTEITDYYNATK